MSAPHKTLILLGLLHIPPVIFILTAVRQYPAKAHLLASSNVCTPQNADTPWPIAHTGSEKNNKGLQSVKAAEQLKSVFPKLNQFTSTHFEINHIFFFIAFCEKFDYILSVNRIKMCYSIWPKSRLDEFWKTSSKF